MKGYRTLAFNAVLIVIAAAEALMSGGIGMGIDNEILLGIAGIGNVVLRMITNTAPMSKE